MTEQSKFTHDKVDYEPIASDINQCEDCQHFQWPRGCSLVESPISPKGWCKLYSEDYGHGR